ncbi:MAG: hypothetical protein H0X62_10120 [Bacteroidetes bacterium]|nr:hypothetical protein [Bacteroidota bacterium]
MGLKISLFTLFYTVIRKNILILIADNFDFMRTYLFLLIFLAFYCLPSNAQNFVCGTITPPNAAALEAANARSATSPLEFEGEIECLNKVLSINFILVTDSMYNPAIPLADLNDAIASLNNRFGPICLSFEICNIDTVYAYKYNRWDRPAEHDEFEALYCRMNVINVALVEDIQVPAGAAGYAPLGIAAPTLPARDLIVIKKESIIGKTFAHEMGHFFGLYHPFETALGIELANGNNCATTGDLVCDTPPDLNPAPINAPCDWVGVNVDANNDFITPLLGNIMSYHPGTCTTTPFTKGQLNRMVFSYKNFRNYLY